MRAGRVGTGRVTFGAWCAWLSALLVLLAACTATTPEATDGTIDLSAWDPDRDGIVRLGGTWRLAPGVLVDPDRPMPDDAAPVHVPGPWDAGPDAPMSASAGVATYGLEIRLPPDVGQLAVQLHGTAGASAAWIDGEPLPLAGVVSTDPTVISEDTRRIGRAFEPSSDTVELRVQVANVRHRASGIRRDVLLGRPGQLERVVDVAVLIDAAASAALITLAIAFLVVFSGRRRQKEHLFFALLALTMAMRTLVSGSGEVLLHLIPDMPWWLRLRIEYVAMPLGALVGFPAITHQTGLLVGHWLSKGLGWLSAVLLVVTALLPMTWLGPVVLVDMALPVLVGLSAMGVLVVAASRGDRSALWMLLATGIFWAAFVHDILLAMDVLSWSFRLDSLGFLAVLLVQGLILVRAFVDAFSQNESLTVDLQLAHGRLERTHTAVLRFVPFAFLDLLGRRSVDEIVRGDHTRQEMHILFCDLRSFTTLIESLGPDRAFPFINRYLEAMEPCITRNGGFINQYLGDAIMALFATSADAAIRAAIDMAAELERFNEVEPEGPVRIGIGLGSGPLMLGTIGSEKRLDGGVIGDSVNGAARLEGMTKIYGTMLLIGDSTWSRVRQPSDFSVRELDLVVPKGRTRAGRIYEVLDALPSATREARLATRDRFDAAVAAYRAGRFEEALDGFRACVDAAADDATAALYVERCERMIEHPPADWDGVTWLTRK